MATTKAKTEQKPPADGNRYTRAARVLAQDDSIEAATLADRAFMSETTAERCHASKQWHLGVGCGLVVCSAAQTWIRNRRFASIWREADPSPRPRRREPSARDRPHLQRQSQPDFAARGMRRTDRAHTSDVERVGRPRPLISGAISRGRAHALTEGKCWRFYPPADPLARTRRVEARRF